MSVYQPEIEPANDNHFVLVTDNDPAHELITARFNEAVAELADHNLQDALILEGLFSTLVDHLYRVSDPLGLIDTREPLQRYNQLSRYAGELDFMKQVMLGEMVGEV